MGVNVVKLEDVCEFYRGLTYSKKDEATFSNKIVLRASNIDLNTSVLNFDDLKYLKEDFNIPEDKKLRKDCIFICMSSGSKSHLGKVAFIDKDYDYAFGGFMGMIKPKANILPKYLFYLLQTPEYKELLRKLSNGININNIKFTDLKDFEFELPTIDEQEKILNTLDKADEIRTKKRLANDKLDEFLKSTFISMFGDPVRNEKGYSITTIGDCIDFNPSKPVLEDDSMVTFLGMKDISEKGAVCLNEEKEYKDVKSGFTNFSNEDVLLAKITPCFENGKSAIVRNLKNGYGFGSTEFHVLRPNTKMLLPECLYQIIHSDCFIKAGALKMSGAVGQKRVPKAFVVSYKIVLPPIEEQNKFAKIVEKVEVQKQKNEQVIEQMDNLFNSLSQRAFKGEL